MFKVRPLFSASHHRLNWLSTFRIWTAKSQLASRDFELQSVSHFPNRVRKINVNQAFIYFGHCGLFPS